MAKIYKVEAYVIAPNNEDYDIDDMLRAHYGNIVNDNIRYKEFDWDDNLPVNNMSSTFNDYDEFYKEIKSESWKV